MTLAPRSVGSACACQYMKFSRLSLVEGGAPMAAEAGGVDEEAISRRGVVVAEEGRRSPDPGPGDLIDRVVEDEEENVVMFVRNLGFCMYGLWVV